MGNAIKGISLIQEGPALGHPVWVDSTTLSQVKRIAAAKGRVKAKLNHWSGIQDTVGYYENFRIRGGKLLADLTLFENHDGKEMLLEMIETIPSAFGVSISFHASEPEYDEANDRYNARCRELYSADFVDTPAANRDGVFEAGIDSVQNDMANATTPPAQPEAFDAKAAIIALEEKLTALTTALEALKPQAPEPKQEEPEPKPDAFAALSAKLDEQAALIKALSIAPKSNTEPAPAQEGGTTDDPLLKTREQFNALSHNERNAFFAAGGKLKTA